MGTESSNPLEEPNALVVAIAQDVKNDHRFRLPSMVRVYVEMKARDVAA